MVLAASAVAASIRVIACSIAWRFSLCLRSVMSMMVPISPATSPSGPVKVALQ